MSYRKKYKCPVCDDYSLYIIHDRACEYESGCDSDDLDIQRIMSENDFCGYYTSKEIEESFFIDDEECNKILKSRIAVNNTLHLLTNREKQNIKSFFEITSKFDEGLDDIVVDYMNINCLKEMPDLTPFGYIIN